MVQEPVDALAETTLDATSRGAAGDEATEDSKPRHAGPLKAVQATREARDLRAIPKAKRLKATKASLRHLRLLIR